VPIPAVGPSEGPRSWPAPLVSRRRRAVAPDRFPPPYRLDDSR